jgi:hypothetical protein
VKFTSASTAHDKFRKVVSLLLLPGNPTWHVLRQGNFQESKISIVGIWRRPKAEFEYALVRLDQIYNQHPQFLASLPPLRRFYSAQ